MIIFFTPFPFFPLALYTGYAKELFTDQRVNVTVRSLQQGNYTVLGDTFSEG